MLREQSVGPGAEPERAEVREGAPLHPSSAGRRAPDTQPASDAPRGPGAPDGAAPAGDAQDDVPGSSASGAGADGAGEGDDADAGLEYGYEIPADPANTASAYFRLGARLGELEADVGDRLDRAASGEAPVPAELVRPSPSVRST